MGHKPVVASSNFTLSLPVLSEAEGSKGQVAIKQSRIVNSVY